MTMLRIDVATFPVPFKNPFIHATAQRSSAENIIVGIHDDDGISGYGEGCPRTYVTGETSASARAFLGTHARDVVTCAETVDALRAWMVAHTGAIEENPAAFCAIEITLLDYLARRAGISVEELLGLPPIDPDAHRFTAVMGGGGMAQSLRSWVRYRLAGLTDFKVKLSGDLRNDRRRLAPFTLPGQPRLRLDANNLWQTPASCIGHIRVLGVPAFAIEEPLGVGNLNGLREVARETGYAIILDESFLGPEVLPQLGSDTRWIVNIRVSKLGGLTRTLDAVKATQRHGIGIIVGAHVGETGLLARAALPTAQAAGDALVAFEGAFGTFLLRYDLTQPSPRFGWRGRINRQRLPAAGDPGLGLGVSRGLLQDVESLP